MSLEIQVRVKSVGDTQQVSEKFKKRELIAIDESNPTYPQVLQFQATQDKVSLLDELRAGDLITVHFNLNGKEFTKDGRTMVFNSLNIWKFDVNQTTAEDSRPAPIDLNAEEEDSLPF